MCSFGRAKCSCTLNFCPEQPSAKQMYQSWSVVYSLSFYRYKIILDCPNYLGRVQIVFVESNLFWFGPNQTFLKYCFFNLDLSKTFWTWLKRTGHVQNDWYTTKMIWTVQNNFETIEGQGIRAYCPNIYAVLQIILAATQ